MINDFAEMIIWGVGIMGIAALGMYIIGRWDRPLFLNKRMRLGTAAISLLEGAAVLMTAEKSGTERLLLTIMGGCLLLASVTDLLLSQVYHFVWWPALAAAGMLLGVRRRQGFFDSPGTGPWDLFLPLVFFLFLQYTIFRRMYGKADYYAFCVCAVAETAEGMGLMGYLIHMLLSYAFLLPVQAFRHNIGREGNLKQPVPFLPYITAAFWVTMYGGERIRSLLLNATVFWF